jgi:3-isopropylmalate/(R)-2-methylmalate dehydratase small subunit
MKTLLKGSAHIVGDNINTDYIISGRYKFSITDPKELAQHIFEDISPDFAKKIKEGDFIVAGENFGCGSSREQAPVAIKAAGVSAVIAQSFARIFYRNAFNVGLPLLICDTRAIADNDVLEADLDASRIRNTTKNAALSFIPIPKLMREIVSEGGVIQYLNTHKGFPIETA